MKLNIPRAEGRLVFLKWARLPPLPIYEKMPWIPFTPKCLISIISVWVKYGPRSATVQPLWLHKSLGDSWRYCLSDSSDAPMTWNWERRREGRDTPLGKSDNPLNIFTWANVQASFNPSNHIKHTQQHPWAHSHILKDLRVAAKVLYTHITSDEFRQFSPLSTNLLPNAPFIASRAHQPSQTACLCAHIYCPILTTTSYKRTHIFFKA